ncbi:MAG: SulP family inorganic anion transporter [Planctomycetes bacterium]|nr:SulP family inorganic anion transporter [Planctomycetota bacterium]
MKPGDAVTTRADVVAGVAVGLLLVPQAMAYAQLAGLPPAMGLWCAAIAGPVAALLGRCHQLNAGPVAMTSVVAAGALAPFAAPGSPDWIALAGLLCLLVAGVRLLLAAVRGAVLADLISQPVLAGFSIAAALVIPATQLPLLVGARPDADAPLFLAAGALLCSPWHWHPATVAMGASCLIALWSLKRWLPRLPGMLLVIAAATATAWACGYDGATVGALPLGLPDTVRPSTDWHTALALLPGAALVAVIGLAEVVTVTRTTAAMTRQEIDTDRELAGQGAAALATAWIAPVVPSASLSRSMLTLREGGRTRLSAAVSGVVALLAALCCGPLLTHLPLAALAAGVVIALGPLLDPRPLLRAWRVSRSDGFAGGATLVATLVLAPQLVTGLAIGVGSSLLLFLRKLMRPRVVELSLHPDGTWRDAERHGLALSDEIAILRWEGRLSFASAAAFEDAVLATMARRPRLRLLVLAAEGLNDLDASGVEALLRMHERLGGNGIVLAVASCRAPLLDVMRRARLPEAFLAEAAHRTVGSAVNRNAMRLGLGPQPWDPPTGP